MADRSGSRLGPRLRRPLGVLSGALLAVSLGGAVLGVAPEAGTAAAPPMRPAAAAGHSASDAVQPGTAAASGKGAPAASASSAAAAKAAAVAAASTAGRPATHAALVRSTPITVALPSIGLTAPLIGLGMDSRGQAELPPFSQPKTAGWVRDSAAPGAVGTAVLVGHVDTRTGPAVFWNLSAVKPGASVEVTRVDGSTALFTVDAVRAFDKSTFPADQLYAPAKDAQLRIVTCGGTFDRKRAEYTGNVVLFAHLSGVRAAAGPGAGPGAA
ncbi:class F sortase [Streptacidiphilus sp. N1-3]|uniref:Class F sortase n=1 Tax=Streptacidiphilus alkalitolerans TaxID=3342712 RepID=A0ABV6WT08_9ACTN